LRYVKASIICGLLAFLASAGLFELGAFRGLDAGLAIFIEQPSPPVVGRTLQYALMLGTALGISWATVDIGRTSLKCAVALVALAECVTAVGVADLFDFYFSPFGTSLSIALAFAFGLVYSQSSPGKRKQTIHQLLGDRVSPTTFDTLLNCDVPLRFEGEVRDASIVVCEVFNHEELMATMRINDYVAMTNSFLRNSADCLVQQGGYLDECDGECLRVVFGAPLPDVQHASRACSAALELAGRLDAVNKECHQVWGQMFDYRIAINSGEMVIAAYGSGRLGTFSVSGEPVEFARRLCAANMIYGSRILLGAATYNAAETEIEVRPMEMIQRTQDATQREEVYELLGRLGMLSEPGKARRQHFWTGIVLYRSQQFDAALVEFRRAVELAGADGPSEFYIRRIEQMKAGLPSLDWSSARL
jgi:class 3 adenylate cyclase